MYQGGYGVRRSTQKAREMYRRAIEFGSTNAQHNLDRVHILNPGAARKRLTAPVYR